jgi:hypothetical protein
MNIKSLKNICISTLTYYPWAMTRFDGVPEPRERFRIAKKEMSKQRQRRLLADGVTRR